MDGRTKCGFVSFSPFFVPNKFRNTNVLSTLNQKRWAVAMISFFALPLLFECSINVTSASSILFEERHEFVCSGEASMEILEIRWTDQDNHFFTKDSVV